MVATPGPGSTALSRERPAAAEVLDLAARAAEVDGVDPLSEPTLIALRSGDGVQLSARTGDELAGFGYVDGDSAELVVHPAHRRQGVGTALARAVAEKGDPKVWAHGRLPAAVALAGKLGYAEERVLWQLRRPLTDPIPDEPLPPGITIRAFSTADEEAWVAVNARAFADHPEQGAWTVGDLRAREAEPWFDPAGFLLAVRTGGGRGDDTGGGRGDGTGGNLAGFHWTKVHPGPPPLGEVYVLGVDPSARGLRLGPALTVAGLRHLRDAGLDTVLLYVDDDNQRAVRLYEGLGFTRFAVDVQFGRPSATR